MSSPVVRQHAAGAFIDRAARVGFLGKGLVAVVVGGVALRLALGEPASLVGPEGALRQFVGHAMGRATLAFLALSLWAHAAWKLVQALLDPEDKGRGIAAVAERIAFGGAALGYAALGLAAARLSLGQMLGSGTTLDDVSASVLTPTLGRWLVGAAGAVVVVMGVLQVRLGLVAGFRHIFPLDRMRRAERLLVVGLGRAGYVSLGIVSGLIGWFLMRVAVYVNPDLAGGWRDALGFLAGVGETRWTLGLVAAGLLCYGLYFILQARYRTIGTVARASSPPTA